LKSGLILPRRLAIANEIARPHADLTIGGRRIDTIAARIEKKKAGSVKRRSRCRL
jgi:hypothetical protein